VRAALSTAVSLGAAGVLVLAVTGAVGAQTAPADPAMAPHLSRLVATTTSFHTTSGAKPKATDVSSFKLSLADRAGHKVGEDRCTCIAVDKDNLVCTGVLLLPGGRLTYTGPFSNTGTKATLAITGGTGAFEGASGSFAVRTRPDTDPAVYDYHVDLQGGHDDWDLPGPDPTG
jgi:hypothetical protein